MDNDFCVLRVCCGATGHVLSEHISAHVSMTDAATGRYVAPDMSAHTRCRPLDDTHRRLFETRRCVHVFSALAKVDPTTTMRMEKQLDTTDGAPFVTFLLEEPPLSHGTSAVSSE